PAAPRNTRQPPAGTLPPGGKPIATRGNNHEHSGTRGGGTRVAAPGAARRLHGGSPPGRSA
ncbi:hypothetical protein, partial [Spongiactinospora gelatinilytica]|uniref:hypothetical protein n=1 Tax=Spongiactinospora gelatinilytica TaxID=2666298 RepID=UPI001F3F5B53